MLRLALNTHSLSRSAATEEKQETSSNPYWTFHMGTYSKLNRLSAGQDTVRGWEPADRRYHELVDDEGVLWRLWHKLRETVLQRRENEWLEA